MVDDYKINGVMKPCVMSETGPQPVKFVLELLAAGMTESEAAEECKITVEQVTACKDSVAMKLTNHDLWKFIERRTAHVHVVKAVCEAQKVDLQSALRGFNGAESQFMGFNEQDSTEFNKVLGYANLEKRALLELM